MTDRRLAGWVFLLFAAIYVMTARGYLSAYDYHDRLLLTRSLVERGTWAVDGGVRTQVGPGDLSYSIYDPGESILFIPFLVAGRFASDWTGLGPPELVEQAACSLLFPLATALSVALLFLLLREAIGASRRASFVLTCIYGLCTMAWPYSKWHAVQSIETVFLLGALLGLAGQQRQWPGWAGAMVAIGFLCRSSLVVAVPALAWLAWTHGGRRSVLRFLVPLLPGIVALLVYNQVRFGNPMALGYGAWGAQFSTSWLVGIPGLLFSSGRGFLFFVPTVWLLPWAWRAFRHDHRALSSVLAGIALGYLLLYGRFEAWYGTESWGPRYLVPLIPLTIIPLVALGAGARRWLVPIACFAAVSQVPPLVASPGLHFRNLDRLAAAGEVIDPIYDLRQSPLIMHWDEVGHLVRRASMQSTDGPSLKIAPTDPPGSNPFVLDLPNFWFFYATALGVDVRWVAGLILSIAGVGVAAYRQVRRGLGGAVRDRPHGT